MIGFGQVYIPDANFKAFLVGNSAINTNGDTEIQVSEATVFNGNIDCSWMNIADLTGIEDFTTLTNLDCGGNQLTYLDVSNNTDLDYLFCYSNQLTSLYLGNNTHLIILACYGNPLTSLDVSQNTSLTDLNCGDNQLTNLDVSQNTALMYLSCGQNQLTYLDVSNNTTLTILNCPNNQLTYLDVSNNTALTNLNCGGNQLTSLDVRNGNNTNFSNFELQDNPSLTCIDVDDTTWSTTNWTVANSNIDIQHYFSNNCPPSAVQEHTTNKELLKVTDLLGRETKQTNQPLFYIYDDGTVEKRIVVE